MKKGKNNTATIQPSTHQLIVILWSGRQLDNHFFTSFEAADAEAEKFYGMDRDNRIKKVKIIELS